LGEKEPQYENKKIVQIQPRVYLIEFNFDFETGDSGKGELDSLHALIEEFKQEGRFYKK